MTCKTCTTTGTIMGQDQKGPRRLCALISGQRYCYSVWGFFAPLYE